MFKPKTSCAADVDPTSQCYFQRTKAKALEIDFFFWSLVSIRIKQCQDGEISLVAYISC